MSGKIHTSKTRFTLVGNLVAGLLVCAALCWAGPARAGLVDYDISVVWPLAESPASVEYTAFKSGPGGDAPYNEGFWAFHFVESQGIYLESDVPVNITEPGHYSAPSHLAGVKANSGTPFPVVPAGSTVDSHFLHLDTRSGPRLEGFVRFSTDIVGVIFYDPDKVLFDPTDILLGDPNTVYPDDVKMRHLELAGGGDWVSLSEDRRALTFSMKDGSCGFDQIRIITAPIPEPHGLLLFAAGGLVVLTAVRRRPRR